MMVNKHLTWLFSAALLILLLSINVYAQEEIPVNVTVSQSAPAIVSVATFSSYTSAAENVPSTRFSVSGNNTVYIQINVTDPNGFEDIRMNGYVGVKIVLWNTTDESDFARFGTSYVNATFESGSINEAVYVYSFVMDGADDTRLGTENPAEFYRVKVQVSDGTDLVESNTSAEQIGNYTYQGTVAFDIDINVPASKRSIHPGESFYAAVYITKLSPAGLANVSVTYTIMDPLNNTVDFYTESVEIDNTVYLLPVLYIPGDAITGQYTFRVLAMYLGVGSWSEINFRVAPKPHDEDGGHRRNTTRVVTPYENVSLDFYSLPSQVYAFQGETKSILAVIENTGNVAVSDVKLELTSPMSLVSILPESVTINPGERKVFIIEIKVPENTVTGGYPSIVKITSPVMEKSANMTFWISENPLDYRKQLFERIDYLSKLTDEVWNEALKVNASGDTENITRVFNLLQRARGKLDEAKDYMNYARYNDTEKALDQAVKFIELGVVELAKIRSQNTVQTITKTSFDVNLIIIAAFFLSTVFFLLLLRRNSRLNRQVRELYELGRIKGMIFSKDTFKNEGLGSLSGSNKGKLN